MGVNSTSSTDWMLGFGQEHSEGSSETVDRADEWCLKEPKSRRQEPQEIRTRDTETRSHLIPASL